MKLTKVKLFRIIFFICFCACWLIVWGESLVPGGQSKEQSDIIADTIINITGGNKPEELDEIIAEKVETVEKITLMVGETYKFDVIVSPENTTDKSIQYYVDSPGVISINNDGLITGLTRGNAIVTVACKKNGDIKTTVDVTVVQKEIEYPETITLERVEPSGDASLNIKIGEEVKYKIVLSDNVESAGEFIWKSLDSSKLSIVSFDEQYVTVKANEIIEKIRIKATARTKSDVYFYFSFKVSGIECEMIEFNEVDLSNYQGQFTVSYYPTNTTETNVTFKSSNSKVIDVYGNGVYKVTGFGEATVTATLNNNKEISVTKEVNIETIIPTNVSFVMRSVRLNETFELLPQYAPTYATPQSFIVESELLEHVEGNYYRPIKEGWERVTVTFPDLDVQRAFSLTVVASDAILQEKVVIDSCDERIIVGSTASIVVSHVEPSNATSQRVYYEPSNPNVLSIDQNGVITAKKVGTSYVYAFSGDSYAIWDRVLVTVVEPPVEDFEIVVDDEYYFGETATLKIKTTPAEASYQSLEYKFDDVTIAPLTNTSVTFRGVGTVTLTVTCDGMTKTKEINVKYLDDIIIEIRDSEGNVVSPKSLIVDEIYTMVYMANGEEINLSSGIVDIQSNRNVIINGNKLQPINPDGSTLYIYDYINKELIKKTSVVNKDIPVEEITISGPSTLKSGDTAKLTCSILPLAVRNKKVEWSVSNRTMASITADGVFTALKKGTVIVTATLKTNKTVKATLEIDIDWVLPTEISFTLDSIVVGDTAKIELNATPADVTNMTIVYRTSNGAVVVSDDGTVTALKGGTVIITAVLLEDTSIKYSQRIEILNPNVLGKLDFNTFYTLVRKGIGHFGAFFILATCLFFSLILREKKKLWKIVVLTIPSVLFIAVVAELLQKIPEGRSCTIDDMTINFLGSLTAIVSLSLIYIIINIIKKTKGKKGATS